MTLNAGARRHWNALELTIPDARSAARPTRTVWGKANTDETVIHCRNCHRKVEIYRNDHPAQIDTPPDLAERAGHFLLGLADVLVLLVEQLRQLGRELIERARSAAGGESGSQL